MQRHSTSDSRQPEFSIRHSSLVTPHSSLVTRHSPFVTRHSSLVTLYSAFSIALAALAAGADEPTKLPMRIAPVGGFAPGYRYEFNVRYPTNRWEGFSFRTGSDFTYVTHNRDGSATTNTTERRVDVALPYGKGPGNLNFSAWHTSGQQGSVEYRLNATLGEATFASMDDERRAMEAAAEREKRDPRRDTARVGIRVENNAYLFFVNGAYILSLPREEGDRAGLSFPASLVVDREIAAFPNDDRWEMVEISERANTGGFGKRYSPAGGLTVVDGVPFFRSRSRAGNDAIDLYQSRFAQSRRLGFRPNACYSRWQTPLAKLPLRFSFRIPAGQYDALHVLCASDGRRDAVPRFTAQFYRIRGGFSGSGRPMCFPSGDVPVSTNGAAYVVTIPLSGDFITEHCPETLNLELTKEVKLYRTYPDPFYVSMHGAGLPSSVRVMGITLHKAETKVSFDPDEGANVFTEGQDVSYTATLENTTAAPRDERLVFNAKSWDGQKTVRQEKSVRLAPGERKQVKFAFKPQRYGWHAVSLEAAGLVFNHSAAYLKAREHAPRPFEHKGLRFGTWCMFDSPLRATFLGKAGFDTAEGKFSSIEHRDELQKIWDKYGFTQYATPGNMRATSAIVPGDNFETNAFRFTKAWGDRRMGDPGSENWKYTRVLSEPGGIGTGNACFPEYYGEPTNAFSYARLEGAEKKRYEDYKERLQVAIGVQKKLYPKALHLAPNGSWTFLIPFLQDPETRPLFDGVKCDFQFYNHLPEEQMHQTSVHSFWYFHKAWQKNVPNKKPTLILGEGPDVHPVLPGASTPESDAALRIRDSIHLAGYGITFQLSWGTDPISIGEFHCNGGLISGAHALNPNWGYCAMATWTRLTRDATFESYSTVGSTSAYCANFRNHKTGKLFRAIWTVRGKRGFAFPCKPADLTVLDPMDNEVKAAAGPDGNAVLTVGQMPYFVFGADDAEPTVAAETDHSDDALAPVSVALGSVAERFKEQAADDDDLYRNVMPAYIKRFPATMEVVATNDAAHGPVLSVTLGEQPVDRMLMPYYTCLHLDKPIEIPGKAAALRLDVRAASDWGRVVFVLKDAAGRRYYSCGQKDQWNADDMTGQSYFNFDGWRRLRVELPSNAPWDLFRESGFATWGSDDPLAPVMLPLAIEKLFVERRHGVMYGNDYVKIEKETPVLLGALHAEYRSEADKGAEAIRLSKLRVPTTGVNQLPNPVAEIAKTATLPAGKVLSVKDPQTWFDGTNGDFAFELPPEAVAWDLWVAPSKDGRGALKLGKGLKKNPCNVSGFLAGETFYAFLVWSDKAGKVSKPSEPFEFKMEDHFAHQ